MVKIMKKKVLTGVLTLSVLSTGFAFLNDKDSPVAKAESQDKVEHFLKTDVHLIEAQSEFTKDNFYNFMIKNRDIESPINFTERPEFTKAYWKNVETLNAQIREINTRWYMEKDEAKKKSVFENELIPKLETLLTFIDSGEKVLDKIKFDMSEGANVVDAQDEEVLQSWASSYGFAEDYLKGLRLMVYAYQELYKYEHGNEVQADDVSNAEDDKDSEISQYLYIGMLMDAYLFDKEKFLEKTQMQN